MKAGLTRPFTPSFDPIVQVRIGLSNDMNRLYCLMRHLEEGLLYNAENGHELGLSDETSVDRSKCAKVE